MYSILSNPVEMVFVKANVKGGKLQKPVLSHVAYCFPWSPNTNESGRLPISHMAGQGSLESAGYSSELLLIFEVLSEVHLEESLCREHALN